MRKYGYFPRKRPSRPLNEVKPEKRGPNQIVSLGKTTCFPSRIKLFSPAKPVESRRKTTCLENREGEPASGRRPEGARGKSPGSPSQGGGTRPRAALRPAARLGRAVCGGRGSPSPPCLSAHGLSSPRFGCPRRVSCRNRRRRAWPAPASLPGRCIA